MTSHFHETALATAHTWQVGITFSSYKSISNYVSVTNCLLERFFFAIIKTAFQLLGFSFHLSIWKHVGGAYGKGFKYQKSGVSLHVPLEITASINITFQSDPLLCSCKN